MISMVLLVVISLSIYQATSSSFRLRETLQSEGDFYSGIRLAMSIMDRDIALVFSPLSILPRSNDAPVGGDPDDANLRYQQELAQREQQEKMRAAGLDRESKFWGGAIDVTGIRPSRFEGTSSSLNFISTSHLRVYKERPESEFTKVTYELRASRVGDGQEYLRDTKTLYKIQDPNAFDLEEDRDISTGDRKHRRVYPLIPGIKKMNIRYWNAEKERWEGSWDSASRDYMNKYPAIVEVTIEVVGPARHHFEGKYLFRPEIPFDGLMRSF